MALLAVSERGEPLDADDNNESVATAPRKGFTLGAAIDVRLSVVAMERAAHSYELD